MNDRYNFDYEDVRRKTKERLTILDRHDFADYVSKTTRSKERLEEEGANVDGFSVLENQYDLDNSSREKDLAQDLDRAALSVLMPITEGSDEALEAGNNYLDKDPAELKQEHGREVGFWEKAFLSRQRISERAGELAREYGARVYNNLENRNSVTREDIIQSFESAVIGEPIEPQHELIES